MAVSKALVVSRLLSLLLLLLVSSTATVTLAKTDLDEAIKTDCEKTKEPEVCRELLDAHPESKTDGMTSAAELAVQVAAKIARESDNDSRSIIKDMNGPSPCLIYCVRDVCAAAQKIAWIPDKLTEDDWTKLSSSLKREVTWTCGKSCPPKPDPKEQTVLEKFTELKKALCVAKDFVQARAASHLAPAPAPAPAPK